MSIITAIDGVQACPFCNDIIIGTGECPCRTEPQHTTNLQLSPGKWRAANGKVVAITGFVQDSDNWVGYWDGYPRLPYYWDHDGTYSGHPGHDNRLVARVEEPACDGSHITDAAWEAVSRNGWHRQDAEEWHKEHGVRIVTVKEWDGLQLEMESCASSLIRAYERLQEQAAELEQLRKGVMPNADSGTVRADAVAGAASAQTRDTSWPPPAHRARWIPFV